MSKRTAKKEDTSSKPWISNYPPLEKWLEAMGARCMQQVPVGDSDNPVAYYESWMTPEGRDFMIVVRSNRMGWNIYTSVPQPEIAATLEDARIRLLPA